jgi:DNA invertase Pin-like site-specific DNA recombinase
MKQEQGCDFLYKRAIVARNACGCWRASRHDYRGGFFHVMSALAEMERELIVERTRVGLAAAREQGRIGGRRRIMTPEVVERASRMLDNGATRQQVADVIGVGAKTIYKYFPAG